MSPTISHNQETLNQDIINLVIARLKTIPSNANLSVGSDKEPLSVDALIEEVKRQSEIGKKLVESQLFFLRSLQDLPIA